MPTIAESCDSDYHSIHRTLQDPCPSWTDDLPVCPLSGVGFSTNQVYRLDGVRKEEHEFEDRSFHFRLDEDTFFYGVFDGQFGYRAVEFASQRTPAEILLGQLKERETDQEIKELLLQAFLTVETTFFQSIDNLLAEKEDLRLQLQGLRTYEAMQKYPLAVQRLNSITAEIESGTTAVVALIHKDKLYVANVGDSRALLVQADASGNIRIVPLSVDHNFQNEDELLRLSQLGLDAEYLRNQYKNFRHSNTRCIGNYVVKGGYKEFDNLSEATEEPIIAEPEIYGGIKMDSSCKFLLLMSDGLYKSLEQATGAQDVNSLIVQIVLEQFTEQSTLTGVAQAAVDKVVRLHHDTFMKNNEFSKNCQKRDDITLLVRNFNYPIADKDISILPLPAQQNLKPKNVESSKVNHNKDFDTLPEVPDIENSATLSERLEQLQTNFSDNSDTVSSRSLFHRTNDSSLEDEDDDGKIKPYVDFSDFYAAAEEAYKQGLVPKEWCRK